MADATETEDARIETLKARQAALRAEAAEADAATLGALIEQATALGDAAARLEVETQRLIVKATDRGQALGPHVTNAVRAARNVGVVLAALKADAEAALKAKS